MTTNTLQNAAEIPNFDNNISSDVVNEVNSTDQNTNPAAAEIQKNETNVSLSPIQLSKTRDAILAINSDETEAIMLPSMLPPTYFMLKLIR